MTNIGNLSLILHKCMLTNYFRYNFLSLWPIGLVQRYSLDHSCVLLPPSLVTTLYSSTNPHSRKLVLFWIFDELSFFFSYFMGYKFVELVGIVELVCIFELICCSYIQTMKLMTQIVTIINKFTFFFLCVTFLNYLNFNYNFSYIFYTRIAYLHFPHFSWQLSLIK